MKFLLYGGLVLLLVPVQTTLLPHIAIWGIKPDLGLVVGAAAGVRGLQPVGPAVNLLVVACTTVLGLGAFVGRGTDIHTGGYWLWGCGHSCR